MHSFVDTGLNPLIVTPQGDQREMKVGRGSRPVEKSGQETHLLLEESYGTERGLSGIIKKENDGLHFRDRTRLSIPKSLDASKGLSDGRRG